MANINGRISEKIKGLLIFISWQLTLRYMQSYVNQTIATNRISEEIDCAINIAHCGIILLAVFSYTISKEVWEICNYQL
jgi:hypothetical protein